MQSKGNEVLVTKNMLIGEVIKKHPESIQVMLEHGMQCIGCHVATWESLEQGAAGHGINIDKLISDINNKIEEKMHAKKHGGR